MSDSKYAVLIPTFGSKTFDIDVLKYANETLNNFNWIIKVDGYEGVGYGETGLVLNFALADEETMPIVDDQTIGNKRTSEKASKESTDTNTVD